MGNHNNNKNNNLTKNELTKLIRKAINKGTIPKNKLVAAYRAMGYIVNNINMK